MDYNYVRMRNARSAGDKALEENYKKLLERGMNTADDSRALTYVIVLLAAVAVILGMYIFFTEITDNGITEAAGGLLRAMAEGVTA